MIRQADSRDEADIRDCARKAYARYVPLIGREPAPMLADYATQIAAGQVFVAISEDGAFQGFITFYAQERYMMLENVAVLPEASGRGIGKALICYCEERAREAGSAAIRLYTNEKMTENLSIYPRLGYVETGRGVESGFSRVFFEKML